MHQFWHHKTGKWRHCQVGFLFPRNLDRWLALQELRAPGKKASKKSISKILRNPLKTLD
jgi:hypothetical protein